MRSLSVSFRLFSVSSVGTVYGLARGHADPVVVGYWPVADARSICTVLNGIPLGVEVPDFVFDAPDGEVFKSLIDSLPLPVGQKILKCKRAPSADARLNGDDFFVFR